MELLQRFIEKVNAVKKTVHVIGDSLLDEDFQVQINRISPECPNVNIILSEDSAPSRVYPGGAANVCFNLNKFNVNCILYCFLDIEACVTIKNYGINFQGKLLPEEHLIPRKKRYYEKGCQVVARWDIEKPNYGLDDLYELQLDLCNKWSNGKHLPDVIIFSDYNKGLFSGKFRLEWYVTNITTVVDPKAAPLGKWEHCTVFKPNSKEAEILSGEKDWKKQCDFFKKELCCRAVVITQEGDGVVGKTDDYFEYRPKLNVKPQDTVGAGDAFSGILGLALTHGFTIEEAAIIAFHAGVIYVQQNQRGTFGPECLYTSKILKNCDKLKNRNYKLVFTNGCYDLVHTGHLSTLEFAKSKGDKLIVAVNSDESVKRLKGPSCPILSLEDRMKLLAALDCVDFVISFEEDTPLEIIQKIKPDVLVKGQDYVGNAVGADILKEVYYVPLIEGHRYI